MFLQTSCVDARGEVLYDNNFAIKWTISVAEIKREDRAIRLPDPITHLSSLNTADSPDPSLILTSSL